MPSPKCDHKVIAWLDYSIPVSLKARWMVQDITGILAFATKPKYKQCSALGKTLWLADHQADWFDYISTRSDINMPEPGPYSEQLYWIG